MCRIQFPAMGTSVSLLLPVGRAFAAGEMVRELFAEWEGVLSRFRPQSELSRLNRRAGMAVHAGELLWEVLSAALAAAEATDGLYDPTLLQQIVALGYDRSFEEVRGQAAGSGPVPPDEPDPGGGWRLIGLDRERRTVMLPAGVGIDLGGIAKGMAVDAAIARLRVMRIDAALVNAGGDLAVHGLPPDGSGWRIAVQGRHRASTVSLRHGALATSGVARRRWRQGGEERHHLLDPRTGRPIRSGLWSVSVAAARCGQAEVAAKAAFALGPEAGARFIAARGLAGLLVREDGGCQAVGAWPAQRARTPR